METLSFNGSATDIAPGVEVAEITLSSPSQSFFENARLGEPVEYVPTPREVISSSYILPKDYQWFYMHASFGKNLQAQEELSRFGIFSYIPYETIRGVSSDGKTTFIRKPIFKSYLFVLSSLEKIKLFANNLNSEYSIPYLHFVYNHADKNEYGASTRMIVPHRSMVSFIRLAEFRTSKVHSVDEKKVRFLEGDPVRIIDGVFKGIEGRVARIHNQTTVVVTLEGIISMTTAYIPKGFMEPIKEESPEENSNDNK